MSSGGRTPSTLLLAHDARSGDSRAADGASLALAARLAGLSVRAAAVPLRGATSDPFPIDAPDGPEGTPLIHLVHLPAPRFFRASGFHWNVGRTWIDTDRLPPVWVTHCNRMDEIWVPSTFCVESFARSGVDLDRLRVIPSPLDIPRLEKARRRPSRGQGDVFRFVALHDGTRRSGADLLVAAFVNEFAAEPRARLRFLLQGRALEDPAAERERLFGLARTAAVRGGAPLDRIEVQDCDRPRLRLSHLAAASAYVHPFRGDGLGRETLEACALGVPVVATRHGAVLDVLHDRNAFLLDCALVSADLEATGRDPAILGHRWAEPLTIHLAELMRAVFEGEEERERRAARAKEEVVASHGLSEVAGRIRRAVASLTPEGISVPEALLESSPEEPSAPSLPLVEGHAVAVSWIGRFPETVEHLGRPLASRIGGAGIRVTTSSEDSNGLAEAAEIRVVGETGRWSSLTHRPCVAVAGAASSEEVQAADEIWTPWFSVRDRLVAAGVAPRRIEVLPCPVDEEIFSGSLRPLDLPTCRRLRFLYLGDATRAGGLDHLLTAYAAAFSERDDVTLVVSTTGAELEEGMASRLLLLQDTPGSPEVLRLDATTAPIERARLYAACDALVLPCRDERASLPLVEAMATGRPIVHPAGLFGDSEPGGTFAVSAERRAFAEEGLLGPAWTLEVDTTALARTLQSIFLDPSTLPTRGEFSREWVRARRGWHALVRRVCARLAGLAAATSGVAS